MQLPRALFFWVTAAATMSPTRAVTSQQDPELTALVEWIRSHGGHVDPRQIVRRENPDDPASLRGVFAAEDIPQGTLLLYIPWSELIVADPDKGDPPDQCGTARALRREMALGDDSRFAPYVRLLNGQRDGGIGLPNAWSGSGLELLDRIVGDNGLTPSDNMRHLGWWKAHCGGDPDGDALGRDAALLQVMRACGVSGHDGSTGDWHEGAVMVPYYDLYNHRNGRRWHNTRIESETFRDFKVLAARDVRVGEQIYNSYGEDAASALRDYGFVEQLPQLWSFEMPWGLFGKPTTEGGKIEFDLDEDEDGGGTLKVDWRVPPPKRAADFMRWELDRLDKVEEKWRGVMTMTGGRGALPQNEAELAWGYHAALRTALSAAAAALESGRGGGSGGEL